jgi:hypothetical protein
MVQSVKELILRTLKITFNQARILSSTYARLKNKLLANVRFLDSEIYVAPGGRQTESQGGLRQRTHHRQCAANVEGVP